MKFGFGDGDGVVMTEAVADVLRNAGYLVKVVPWGFHNVVINSILKADIEQIPQESIRFGYDEPRDYLPEAIINLLDQHLDEYTEVVA